ncbi:MAG: LptA/OstA family protein [Aestuariivita sp.]|nr:LptA/OstA family protein [Aestuariivita sp.]MCY4348199.1 LptA/OstA family protein [Aestuariivita sp.]
MVIRFLSIISVSLLVCSTVLAQGATFPFASIVSNPDLPLEVLAKNMQVNQETGETVFTDEVVISQGEIKLQAPTVTVTYDESGSELELLKATGGVILESPENSAEANTADYTIKDGLIVMTGDVFLLQGKDRINAERMTVNLATGTAIMEGRVRAVLGGE